MDSVYDGLLEGDSSQWAFGTSFEDPLAGVDTTVPSGVEPAELAAYCLMLADDALVASARLSEWCSRAPELEEDIALANMALDLLGQARLLLARAAAADPAVVPLLPAGSPVPAEDALAFFRDVDEFLNVRLAEAPNGDFAHVVVRILLFSSARLAVLQRLRGCGDAVLAAVAAKGVKELTYHRDWSGRWFLTLARGTDESSRRLRGALDSLWPFYPELVVEPPAVCGVLGVDFGGLGAEVDGVLDLVFEVSGVERPRGGGLAGAVGRDGVHTEALSRLLAEMQVVARAHPMGCW
ncbi:1,2-phenylacetyl-CoA epoxidase subunit PaaC [Cryptosporangium phraense]|uniref:Phenylacetate-CoA oxygenase subunit PaaC n=1 Tax=Cryptosporangium phraense TaxID=2593070 RepID=A0A545AQA2_9ACTN|nr:1,2-phenylacetyl-CoA epoxidase subunit PaaC [Cryptosporangium phraense]TQS42915.1 phenylacetate-CoA oxygenase subunit PaaC [Cryptosporangium phraense]